MIHLVLDNLGFQTGKLSNTSLACIIVITDCDSGVSWNFCKQPGFGATGAYAAFPQAFAASAVFDNFRVDEHQVKRLDIGRCGSGRAATTTRAKLYPTCGAASATPSFSFAKVCFISAISVWILPDVIRETVILRAFLRKIGLPNCMRTIVVTCGPSKISPALQTFPTGTQSIYQSCRHTNPAQSQSHCALVCSARPPF